MNDAAPDNGIPRGAIIVVAIGLIACAVAALAATGKGEGEAASLEWVQRGRVADSKPVELPGGGGTMQLVDSGVLATGANVSGYSLFRVASTLRIDAGAPVGSGRILCSVKARQHTEISQTAGGLRATYPRSSEDGIYGQDVPETILIDFSARGSELAVLEFEGAPERFTTEKGVKLEWPEYKVGTERLKYFLPAGMPKQDLELPFYTVWKSTAVPKAAIGCTVTTSAGTATARTAGALNRVSPPIDEEAEEENEEQAEEEAEEAEEKSEG
jgi:hypothetical protein